MVLIVALAIMIDPIRPLHAAPNPQDSEVLLGIVQEETRLGEASGAAGDRVAMEIIVEGAQELRGMEFKLQFDKSVAEIVADGVETEGTPPGFLVLANADNPGVLVFALAGSEPAGIGRFRLARVTFHLVGAPGQSTSLSFTEVQAGDNSVPVKDTPVILAAGSLSIETTGPTTGAANPTASPTTGAAGPTTGAADPASGGPSATGPATTGVPQATTPPTSVPGPAVSPPPGASAGQPTTESASPPQNAGGGCNPGPSPAGDTWDGGWLLLGLLSPGLALRWVRNRGISQWSNHREVLVPPSVQLSSNARSIGYPLRDHRTFH